jgi:hypothetical protein
MSTRRPKIRLEARREDAQGVLYPKRSPAERKAFNESLKRVMRKHDKMFRKLADL